MEKRSRRWEKRDVQDVIARYMAGVDVFTIAEEFGRPVASIRTLIYRHELPRKKVRAMDRVKLDCMPDPLGWMGGKNNLHKTVCHETDI